MTWESIFLCCGVSLFLTYVNVWFLCLITYMIMTMAMEETKIDEMRNYFLLTCSTNCLPLWMTTTRTVLFKNSPTERSKATWTPTEEIWKRKTEIRVGFNFPTNHHRKDGGQDGGSTPSGLSARVRPSSNRYIINQMIDILISNSCHYDDTQWLPNCSYLSKNHSCPQMHIYIIWRI